jgi:tetratricopeptide (TPR) repeat protein
MTNSMQLILSWFVVWVCLLGALGEAHADAKPLAKPTGRVAREHLSKGNRLYDMRSFDEAIVEYKAGALAQPTPVFDYNLGQAYRQLGRYEDAVWHYERFLTFGKPSGDLLEAVNRFLAEMRAQLANRAQTMPPTGPAASDGSPAVSAQAASRAIVERSGPTERVERDAPSGSRDSTHWLGWTALGAGAAAIGTSGVLLWRGSALHDQANTEPDARRRSELHTQAGTRTWMAAVAGIGGAALTVTGVVMLMSTDRRSAHVTSWDFRISGHGVFVAGNF